MSLRTVTVGGGGGGGGFGLCLSSAICVYLILSVLVLGLSLELVDLLTTTAGGGGGGGFFLSVIARLILSGRMGLFTSSSVESRHGDVGWGRGWRRGVLLTLLTICHGCSSGCGVVDEVADG